MPVDYDLVILGGTAYARRAALQAAGYGARVALVEPPGLFEQQQRQQYLLKGLQQLGDTVQRQALGALFGLSGEGKLDWRAVLNWVEIAAETQSSHLSVEVMSANGIDAVLEAPRRLTRKLNVETENRRLKARGILAAFGKLPTVIEALQSAHSLPQTISIEGASPEAVAWAFALSHCGISVELVAEDILRGEDKDVKRLVRSHLISSGINIYPDQILTDCTQPALPIDAAHPALELPSFISLTPNQQLQTNHHRVFACGSILGGSANEALAQYEAEIAVRNALFRPDSSVSYECVPTGCAQFARVGLTQVQAEKRYGSAMKALVASSAIADCLEQIRPSPHYCKLVCADNRLVGVHLIGAEASNLVRLLALHINKPVGDLSRVVGDGLLELVGDCVRRSQQTQWQHGQWRRDWAENWFNWRRSR